MSSQSAHIAHDVVSNLIADPRLSKLVARNSDIWYDIKDVAIATGMSKRWVQDHIGFNTDASPPQIPMIRVGEGRTAPYRITRKAFQAWQKCFFEYYIKRQR